jgi:CRISPR system Cascade subunit CasC
MTSNNIFKDRFLQIHLLTSYPPANLNRDDLGRPKTAVMGNVERLRISSQSLKRAWRTSELFSNAFETEIGIRTRKMADEIVQQLQSKGFEKNLLELVKQSLSQLISKGKDQVLHFSQAEQTRLLTEGEAFATSLTEFATTLTGTEKAKEKALKAHLETISQDINIFVNDHKNIDIALFGRMLTSSPKHNMEAACCSCHYGSSGHLRR